MTVTDHPTATRTEPTSPGAPTPGPEADDAPSARTFFEFGVDPLVVEALARTGITTPFPIQALTLPVALAGHDIIGQAKTGTGKTLGFGLPLLQHVTGPGEPGWDDLPAPGKPQALVVVPTRELAVQVAADLEQAASLRPARVLTVYGGRAYEPQVEALAAGIEVVVGTPGRLLDLAQQGRLTLGHVRTVVLDEADEMLDLGFLPDVERILSLTPEGRHTMLFSATMPGPVVAMARRYMAQPTHIRASEPDDPGQLVRSTKHFVYRAHSLDKSEVLARILQARGRGLTMVFTKTKRTAARVADELADRGFATAAIHGDLGQAAREQALRAFRRGKVDVLVATDVAARGIDVDDVTHVVNYQCPEDEKTYVHRIGRTGRAGKKGTAVTFVDWDDVPRWSLVDKALGLGIPQPVETYSTSPHLYSDLDIPEGTRGVLPRAERTRAGLAAEAVEDLGETGGRRRSPLADGGRPHRGRRHRGAHADADGHDEPREQRRRTRTRRRTRAGQPVDRPAADARGTGANGTGANGTGANGADGRGAGEAAGVETEAGSGARRRRRTRRVRGAALEGSVAALPQPEAAG